MTQLELDELALALMGYTEEKTEQMMNDHNDDIEILFMLHFDLGYEQLEKLIEALLPFTQVTESPLSKEIYHVIGRHMSNGTFMSLVKREHLLTKKESK